MPDEEKRLTVGQAVRGGGLPMTIQTRSDNPGLTWTILLRLREIWTDLDKSGQT